MYNAKHCCPIEHRNGIENHFAHANFPWKWDIRFESTRIKSPKYIGNLERSKVRYFFSILNKHVLLGVQKLNAETGQLISELHFDVLNFRKKQCKSLLNFWPRS